MNVFLANVGNRDIWLDTGGGFYAFSKGRDASEMAKYLGCQEGTRYLAAHVGNKNNLEKFRPALRFPILVPSISAALERVSTIHRVILFATNQKLDAGPHRDWDTIESAKLIREAIPGLFVDKIDRESIEIIPVEFNPSEHDRAFEFIGLELDKLLPEFPETVFASIKGGIPAMNAALRERVAHRYGKRAWLIETDEPPEGKRWEGIQGEARIISSWPFRRDSVVRLLKELLDRFDYAGALRLIDLEGVDLPHVTRYLKHALARLNLDFKGATVHLKDMTGTPQQWQILGKRAWEVQRLADVAYTAQNALEREDYGVFLSRVATFRENCLRFLCWALTNLKASETTIGLNEIKADNRELATYVSENLDPMDGNHRRPEWKVDRKFFLAVIRWALRKDPANRELIEDALNNLDEFKGLEDMRNKFEHRMGGVSRGDIEQVFRDPNQLFPRLVEVILNALSRVKRVTGKGASPLRNVYQEINEAVAREVASWKP